MPREQISIQQDFNMPVEELFDYLAEHENLEALFSPIRIKRLRDGESSRNGVGSARSMFVGPGPAFVETTTQYKKNELIEYRITEGFTPLKNHRGIMRFSGKGDISSLDYRIEFDGKFPGIASLVRILLRRSIQKGLNQLS